jgi:hypothetical protein
MLIGYNRASASVFSRQARLRQSLKDIPTDITNGHPGLCLGILKSLKDRDV